jgi:ribosomal protein L37AE/L43A|tara:strand:+ start:899 stop:1675 length:777 start_codon:yes stop_codon:yes gene_type:complete
MNINKLLNDITLINGDTKRMDCPECNGKRTFTITNNMGSIVWNCYKAGCTVSGGRRVHLSSDDIRKSLGKTVSETRGIPKFDKPEWLVRDSDKIAPYCEEWGLDAEELGLLYDVKEHRVVFPVMHNGHTVDATGRSLGKRLPKWKRYGKNVLPYAHGYGSVAVVVEDCVSAAVIGSHVYVGVAVLGTSLSESHKRYLAQFSTAVIALDPDALPKTLQFAKELRGYVDTVRVLRLNDDLKYRNPDDLQNLTRIGEQEWN